MDTHNALNFMNLGEDQLLALDSSPDAETDNLLFRDIGAELSSPSDITSPPVVSSGSSPAHYSDASRMSACEVTLYHKPRNGGGVWHPVSNGEGLRVTKGKGKRLKLRIKLHIDEVVSRDQIQIGISDLTDETCAILREGFSIENYFETNDVTAHEMEIKLVKYCKRLQFVVNIATSANVIQAYSIEFSSHNNGKAAKTNDLSPNPNSQIPAPSHSNSSGPTAIVSPPSSLAPSYEPIYAPEHNDKKRKEMDGTAQSINVVDGSLEVHGIVRAHAYFQFSDMRLKTNITDLLDAIDIVGKLQGKLRVEK